MKIPFLILFPILLLPLFSKADRELVGSVNKMGITIKFSYSSREKGEKYVDSILNRIISKINRKDTNLQVLVIVNNSYLTFYKSPYQNFISLGYDTLRELDFRFIYDYCNNKNIYSENTYRPLDINATSSDTVKEVGIKIIYSLDNELGEPDWSILEKLIYFSVNNLEALKNAQRRTNVLYGFKEYWTVSLMTLDTLSIQSIIKYNVIDKKQKLYSNNKYSRILISLLIFISLFYVWKRKHSR